MLGESVFPKELRPCMSRIFSSKPSILISNWESLPQVLVVLVVLATGPVDVRTSFRHFPVGAFAIFSLLVSHFRVLLHHHVYEGKKIVKLVLQGGHPNLLFIRPTRFSRHSSVCTDKILQTNSVKLDFEFTIRIMTLVLPRGKPRLGMSAFMMRMIALCINK
jgi:hypothetical protein